MTRSDKCNLRAPKLVSASGCTFRPVLKDLPNNLHAWNESPVRPTKLSASEWCYIIGVLVFLFAARPSEAQRVWSEELGEFEGPPPIVLPASPPPMPLFAISSPALPSPAFNTLDTDCAVEPQYKDPSPIDRQKDWYLGHKLALKIATEETLVEDPVVMTYLNHLEQQLVEDAGLNGCFIVELIVDTEVNAYSLPGGFLYLTTGLVTKIESEGELVAALAHETAHVTARHFARIEHKRRLGHNLMLAGGPAGLLAGQLFGPILLGKQMRNAEFEADRLCLEYQHASGYDVGEFTTLLRKIVQKDNDPSSPLARMFDTHPSIKARIRRLQTQSSQLRAISRTSIANDEDFRRLKEYVSSHFARH